MADFNEMLSNALSKQGLQIDTSNENSLEARSLISENQVQETEKPENKEVETTESVENPAAETTVQTEEKPTETTQKSFEEYLAEKTGGKYSKWEDVEAEIKPKDDPFADDEIRTLNELKKQGVKFDKDFWELQTKDFNSMKDPDEILIESMRRNKDYKGWTEKELKLELDEKYRRKEWSDEGDEANEIETLMSKRLLRDAENAKEDLVKLKESLTIVKQPDAKAIEAQQKAAEQAKLGWETLVGDIAKTANSLSMIVDEKSKDNFDYTVSDSVRTEAAEIMKELATNPLAVFNQFKNADGSYDNKAIFDMLLWIKSKDNITKAIYQNAKAKGAETEVKGLKNTNFKTDGKPLEQKTGGLVESLKKHNGIS
jgi:hypothetical protein